MRLMRQPSVLEVIPVTLNYRIITWRSRSREAVNAVLTSQIADEERNHNFSFRSMSIQNDKQKAPHGQRSWDASFIDVINF